MQELQRPVFSFLEGRPLSQLCSFLPYDAIERIAALEHLRSTKDAVLEDFAEYAEED
jgi:hypothetical protein